MEQVLITLARMETVLLNLDRKVDKLDLRVDRLEQRMDRQFLWVVGLQMTIFLSIVGGLFGIIAKLV
jgi:hypothetical protein